MNYAGCKRKFNVPALVARYRQAAENAHKYASKASAKGDKKRQQTMDSFVASTTKSKKKKV